MRAWLLFLAVLATFQTIVQVASTEDNTTISSRFIHAIQPIKKDIFQKIEEATQQEKPSSPRQMSTALMDFHGDQMIVYQTDNQPQQITTTKSDSDKLMQTKQQPQQQVQNIDKQVDENKNLIIEIKNIEEIERNDLNELKLSANKAKSQSNKPSENLTEDKEDNLKYKKNNKHKKTKMALSVKEDNKENVKIQQNQKNNNNNSKKLLEQQQVTEDVAMAIQKSSSSQQQQQQHFHQQQTQPASQQQQQQQHHHHQHHPQHHNHHNSHHTDLTSTTTPPTSDNFSSSSSSTATSTANSLISIVTSSPTTPMDVDLDVVAEDDEPQTMDAVIAEDGPRTYSNKEIIGDKVKPDPSTLVEIENSLLSLFNMKRPPKIDRSKIIIPEAMKQLYAQIMGHELNSVNIPKPGLLTKSANTVRSFTHQDSKIDDRFPHHHRFRLYFDIKSIPTEEKLKAAELQLTRDAISHATLNPRLANRTRYQVLVYDITRVGVRGKREPSYLLLDNKTIRLNSTDTVSLDVQPAVDRWLASPKKNFGLLVEVRTSRSLKPAPHHHVRLRRSADEEEHGMWQHKQPLLITYTDDGRHKSRSIRDVSNRSKRANGHHRRQHRRKNGDETCRRHSLYVDFQDVGWSDWIVAPPGYDAFYCHGRCPFPLADHLNSTNHAVVQTIVNNINPGKVPKACCVPTQLESISMLYLNDQNTVVLKNYQDMTVVGCGCR